MDTSEYRDRLRQPIDDETNSPSTCALKSSHDELSPISRLPPEILAAIFAFLPPSAWNKEDDHLARIRITHVCHRWRATALDYPLLWSHINLTKLTPVGMAEILARAKMAPLYLEADTTETSTPWRDAFRRQLDSHISHTRHLGIRGNLESTVKQLESPAPMLEFLSLSHHYSASRTSWLNPVMHINIFNLTAPSLTSLELERCNISWNSNSPLLKGLRTLKIVWLPTEARPKLEDWLDALSEMTQLETLILQSATPLASLATLLSELSRTVTVSSLTRFEISASAKDCALALAHLVLPALTWLHVDVQSHERKGEDVRFVIPHVAQNVHRLQDAEPLRSILIKGKRERAEVLAWTMPDADVKVVDQDASSSASVSASLVFTASGLRWRYGVENTILDALLTLLPVNSISTLSAQNRTRLSKAFWLNHAPRWPLLEQARLVPTAVKGFRDMLLAEDAPTNGPRVPSLTRLVLVGVTLTAARAYDLRDMLIERAEQGVPLDALDLRACIAADRAIQLLTEIVVDVQEPLAAGPTTTEEPSPSHSHERIGYQSEVEYDNKQRPWEDNHEMESDDESVEYDDVNYDGMHESDNYDTDYDSDSEYDYDSLSSNVIHFA
jgi:hypothetical protein